MSLSGISIPGFNPCAEKKKAIFPPIISLTTIYAEVLVLKAFHTFLLCPFLILHTHAQATPAALLLTLFCNSLASCVCPLLDSQFQARATCRQRS